jgi:hypothetical protein
MFKKLMMALMGPKAVAKMIGEKLSPMFGIAQDLVNKRGSVNANIVSLQEAMKTSMPAEAPGLQAADIAQMKAENVTAKALKVGDIAPDFTLKDQDG